VDQAIGTAKIDEGTEIGNAGDPAMPGLSLNQLIHDPLALSFLPGPKCPPLRKNQTAALAVHLNDPESYALPDHGL
jgi:hypothetical protein